MNFKHFFLALFSLISLAPGFGQIEKTIHQTFEIGESTTIQLALFGEYTLAPWAGNNILVETNIQLYNSSESIMKHFIEKDQRYKIDVDTSAKGTLKLFSHDKKRPAMRSKSGVVSTEHVEVHVFIPEKFAIIDNKTLVLEAEKD